MNILVAKAMISYIDLQGYKIGHSNAGNCSYNGSINKIEH